MNQALQIETEHQLFKANLTVFCCFVLFHFLTITYTPLPQSFMNNCLGQEIVILVVRFPDFFMVVDLLFVKILFL